jgi:hypothetical protein
MDHKLVPKRSPLSTSKYISILVSLTKNKIKCRFFIKINHFRYFAFLILLAGSKYFHEIPAMHLGLRMTYALRIFTNTTLFKIGVLIKYFHHFIE